MQLSYFFPWWILVLLFIVFVAWIYGTYFRLRETLSSRKRYLFIGLRIAAVVVLLFSLLAPALTSQEKLYPKSHLLVLLDQSESMSIQEQMGNASSAPETSRFQRAQQILTNVLPRLEEEFQVHLYAFGHTVNAVEDLAVLEPDAPATNITGSLDSALRDWRGQSVEAMVLMTDGQDTTASKLSPNTEVPTHAIGFGDPIPPRDVKLGRITVPPVGYAEHPFDVAVTVRNHGFQDERIPISLTEGSQTLGTQTLILDAAQSEQQIRFEVTPATPGHFTYKVEIPTVPGELTSTNNTQFFSVRVVQAKLRVLVLEGTPSWESKFLKRALEADPNIELTYSLVSRRPSASWSQTQLERTRGYYPYDGAPSRLPETIEELRRFDVLMLGDIAPQRLSDSQTAAITTFVEGVGKSVVFLAAPASFGRQGWQNSALAPLLPVQVGQIGARQLAVDFRPALTTQGLYHPMTQLGSDNMAVWQSLPSLSSLYQGLIPKAGTTVLAEHAVGAQHIPILAHQRYGNGKCLLVATDTLWNWAFQGVAFGEDDSTYRKFWSQTIRWLSTYSDAKRVNLSTDRGVYQLNEVALVQVRTYDANYLAGSMPDLELSLKTPDGQTVELFPNERDTGVYETRVRLQQPGSYQVTAGVESVGADQVEWLVEAPSVEYDSVELDEPWLRALAESAGGTYVSEAEAESVFDQLKPSGEPVTLTHTDPLWDSPWLFLLAVGLLGTEWFLRKRNGLV